MRAEKNVWKKMKESKVYQSGIFTIREYALEGEADPVSLVRLLQAGPGEIQEVIFYVFDGADPLGIDTKSLSAEEFLSFFPKLDAYGPGLAFDVILRVEGSPVTVELTKGEGIAAVNSLDAEITLNDLLGSEVHRPDEKMPEQLSPEQLLQILSVAERLKCNTRHCDTSSGRRESVAEHSWRLALMAMLLRGVREYRDYDLDRVIRMCLIHDLGEAFTGDIPTFEKTGADTAEEEKRLAEWVDAFPGTLRRDFQTLYREMQEGKTPEAQLYKALDKMEAVIQHNESDIASWLPLEYDLQRTYGTREVQFSPFLRSLKKCVDAWTAEKIAAEKI